MEPLNLVMGKDDDPVPEEELRNRILEITLTVEKYLPEFAKKMKQISKSKKGKRTGTAFHQDTFAFNFSTDELVLLGMAIKYAGMYGVTVIVIGQNDETLNQKKVS